jgi:hypothetical protein
MSAILIATIMLDGGLRPLRVATEDYYSRADDSIGAQHFQARIIRTPVVDVSIGCAVWGKRSSSSVGQLVLADQDQTLDTVGELGSQRDSLVEMRLVERGQAFDDGVVVCLALVDEITRADGNVLVKLRATDAWLDRPVANSVFAALGAPPSSSTSSSEGLDPSEPTRNLTEVAELVGDPVPVVLGKCWQVDAPLVGVTDPLAHQITDARVRSLDAVLSGGAVATPVTEYVAVFKGAGWEWLVTPAARVLCNVDGFRALDDPIVFGNFADNPPSSDGPGTWQYGTGDEPVYRPGVGLDWIDGGDLVGSFLVVDIDGPVRYAAVVVDVAFLGDGASVEVAGDYTVTIRRPGRWARVVSVSGAVVLRMTGRVVLRSAGVYVLRADSSGTLTEMIRHLSIARAGIHTGTRQTVTEINTSFETQDEFDQWEVGTTGNASADAIWDNEDLAAELFVIASQNSVGGVTLTWPVVLPAGQYTLDVNTFLGIGSAGTASARIEAVPPDDSAQDWRPIVLVKSRVGTESRTVTFSMAAPWRLRAILETQGESMIYQLRDITLSRTVFAQGVDVIDLGTAAEIDDGATLGAVFTGRQTVAEALDFVLSSVCGYYYTTPTGAIAFGRLEDADTPPRINVTRDQLLSWPTVIPDMAERLSDRWAAGRNWTPYDEADLAGITFPDRPPLKAEYRHVVTGASSQQYARTYTHAIGAPPIETPIYGAADAQALADRVSALYTRERVFVSFDYLARDAIEAATLRPGMCARLSAPEFPDSVRGQDALIVATSHELRTLTVRVTCWTAAIPTAVIAPQSLALLDDDEAPIVDDDGQLLEDDV